MTSARARSGRRRTLAEREILDRAADVLAERGPDGVTLRGLAADLGMAASGVHYYFPSRDDLLARLVIETFQALTQAVSAAGDRATERDGSAEPGAAFRTAAHRYVAWANAQPDLFGLAHSPTATRLKGRPGLLPAKDHAVRALTAPLLAALDGGLLDPPAPPSSPPLRRQLQAWSRAIGETTLGTEAQLAALTAYTVVHGHATLTSTGSLPRELLEDGGHALLDAQLDRLVTDRRAPPGQPTASPIAAASPACRPS